ncbi:MAG: hypothetical protein AB7O67_07580 [Vicinamibacterales bacterium]
MTDRVRAAVDELSRTIREIRESSGPAVVRRQDGDFFAFSTPGGSPGPVPAEPLAPHPERKRE